MDLIVLVIQCADRRLRKGVLAEWTPSEREAAVYLAGMLRLGEAAAWRETDR